MIPLRFALIGDPVAHSKSPGLHAAAYRALGLPHVYELWRTSDAALEAAVGRLRTGEVAGLNVTVPHKRAVLRFVDEIDRVARVTGAANTLALRDGRVVAYNTDVLALADELAALAPGVTGGAAIVLGSGGAARAAIVALATKLAVSEIQVIARRDATAMCAELESSLSAIGCILHISSRTTHGPVRWIVQATSAGMIGADPGDAIAREVPFYPEAVVLDVVYAPPETPFVLAARAAGLPSAGGLGMLTRQAASAFELWLGIPAPLVAMRAAL